MTKPIVRKSSSEAASSQVSAPLAEQMLHRLNGYAIAASAAGVALLACSNSAEASPVCGSLSVTLNYTDTYAFNPAHQKVAPFNAAHTYNEISSHTQSRRARGFFIPNTPGAMVLASTKGLPTELASGATIGAEGNFGKGKEYGLLFGYYYRSRFKGNFPNDQSGYVGFQFSESGQTHYGWLRVRVANLDGLNHPSLLLSEFGYESSPNTAITAGNCGSSAASTKGLPSRDRNTSGRIAGSPTEGNERTVPASLGMLALGSEGIPLWRPKKPE